MTYTPEELLEYAKEHNLQQALTGATFNNTFGYAHVPVEAKFIHEEGGEPYLYVTIKGTDTHVMDFNITDEETLQNIQMTIKAHGAFRYEFISLPPEYYLLVAMRNKQKEADEMMEDKILVDFMGKCGIDTKGRLKAVIHKSEELIDEDAKRNAFIMNLENRKGLPDKGFAIH